MRTTSRRTAARAIGASALLLAATACSSTSDDSTGESLPDAAVEATENTDTAPLGTDAASTTTPADTDTDNGTNTNTGTGTGSDSDSDDPATTEAAVVVPEALQFTAPLVGGGTFDGAAVAGKPTVFWFWAPT